MATRYNAYRAINPINTLKRAVDFEKLGKFDSAIEVIESYLKSGRIYNISSNDGYEPLLEKYIDLSLQKRRVPELGLKRYHIICHQSSMPQVHLNRIYGTFLVALDNYEDEEIKRLNKLFEKEKLLEKQHESEWLQFQWQCYLSILHIIRFVPELVNAYQKIVERAVCFCVELQRVKELKHLHDVINNHTIKIKESEGHKDTPSLNDPSVLQAQLISRFTFFASYMGQGCYSDCLRIIEEVKILLQKINNAQNLVSPAAFKVYFESLAQFFAVTKRPLLHALCLYRLYHLSVIVKEDVEEYFETLRKRTIIATFSIPEDEDLLSRESILDQKLAHNIDYYNHKALMKFPVNQISDNDVLNKPNLEKLKKFYEDKGEKFDGKFYTRQVLIDTIRSKWKKTFEKREISFFAKCFANTKETEEKTKSPEKRVKNALNVLEEVFDGFSAENRSTFMDLYRPELWRMVSEDTLKLCATYFEEMKIDRLQEILRAPFEAFERFLVDQMDCIVDFEMQTVRFTRHIKEKPSKRHICALKDTFEGIALSLKKLKTLLPGKDFKVIWEKVKNLSYSQKSIYDLVQITENIKNIRSWKLEEIAAAKARKLELAREARQKQSKKPKRNRKSRRKAKKLKNSVENQQKDEKSKTDQNHPKTPLESATTTVVNATLDPLKKNFTDRLRGEKTFAEAAEKEQIEKVALIIEDEKKLEAKFRLVSGVLNLEKSKRLKTAIKKLPKRGKQWIKRSALLLRLQREVKKERDDFLAVFNADKSRDEDYLQRIVIEKETELWRKEGESKKIILSEGIQECLKRLGEETQGLQPFRKLIEEKIKKDEALQSSLILEQIERKQKHDKMRNRYIALTTDRSLIKRRGGKIKKGYGIPAVIQAIEETKAVRGKYALSKSSGSLSRNKPNFKDTEWLKKIGLKKKSSVRSNQFAALCDQDPEVNSEAQNAETSEKMQIPPVSDGKTCKKMTLGALNQSVKQVQAENEKTKTESQQTQNENSAIHDKEHPGKFANNAEKHAKAHPAEPMLEKKKRTKINISTLNKSLNDENPSNRQSTLFGVGKIREKRAFETKTAQSDLFGRKGGLQRQSQKNTISPQSKKPNKGSSRFSALKDLIETNFGDEDTRGETAPKESSFSNGVGNLRKRKAEGSRKGPRGGGGDF